MKTLDEYGYTQADLNPAKRMATYLGGTHKRYKNEELRLQLR